MTQGKHTPGPWRIRAVSKPMEIIGNIHQVTDVESFPTAFVPAWDSPAAGEVYGTEEALANAHLIAAAPDMLEVLREAREHVAGSAPEWHYRTQEMVALIDAVIAKATGDSQ